MSTPQAGGVVCVAVVGRAKNPLFIKSSATDSDDIELQYMVHSALDIVEEKVATPGKSADSKDLYLGLLQPAGESHLYGYVTSTGISFVLVVSLRQYKESEIKAMFQRLHEAYSGLVRNPFYKPDTDINSKAFDAVVDAIMGRA